LSQSTTRLCNHTASCNLPIWIGSSRLQLATMTLIQCAPSSLAVLRQVTPCEPILALLCLHPAWLGLGKRVPSCLTALLKVEGRSQAEAQIAAPRSTHEGRIIIELIEPCFIFVRQSVALLLPSSLLGQVLELSQLFMEPTGVAVTVQMVRSFPMSCFENSLPDQVRALSSERVYDKGPILHLACLSTLFEELHDALRLLPAHESRIHWSRRCHVELISCRGEADCGSLSSRMHQFSLHTWRYSREIWIVGTFGEAARSILLVQSYLCPRVCLLHNWSVCLRHTPGWS